MNLNTTEDRLLATAETGKPEIVAQLSIPLINGMKVSRGLTKNQLNRVVHSLLTAKKKTNTVRAAQGWVSGNQIPEILVEGEVL